MTRPFFLVGWESNTALPYRGALALKHIGFDMVRIMVPWDVSNPSAGVFTLDKTKADVAAARAAGLKVYADVRWCPPWAVVLKEQYPEQCRYCAKDHAGHDRNQQEGIEVFGEGGAPSRHIVKHEWTFADPRTAYMHYADGPWVWNDPSDGSKGFHYGSELAYLERPPHINPEAARSFGAALARTLGRKSVYIWSIGNEPGGDVYWPPIRTDSREVALERLQSELVEPFTNGVRSYIPAALFAGPEADSDGVLDGCLRIERAKGRHLYDWITDHPYAWKPGVFPDNSYVRIGEFNAAIEAAVPGDTRPRGFSEVGDEGTGRIVEWAREVISRFHPVVIGPHDFRQFFEEGTWDKETYRVNQTGIDMARLIAETKRA